MLSASMKQLRMFVCQVTSWLILRKNINDRFKIQYFKSMVKYQRREQNPVNFVVYYSWLERRDSQWNKQERNIGPYIPVCEASYVTSCSVKRDQPSPLPSHLDN